MKKLTTYLSIFLILLALGACGDHHGLTGPDPDPNPGPPPTENNDYQTLDVTVTLPEGSAVDLSQTTVLSLSVPTKVDASGHSKMAYNKGTTQLAYLFDSEDNLLLAGFVNADHPEINIQTTTEVLFYIGLGTIFLPQEIKDKFIAQATTIEGFDAFKDKMSKLFVGNPTMLQDGDFADPLKAKIKALRQHETIDLPTTQLQVDGADIRSGLQLADVDFEHITITNTYRRRAHAFLYKTAHKDENGKETIEIPDISGSVASQMDIPVSSTSTINGYLGVIEQWAAGEGADFAAKKSDPLQLPLENTESEATYKVRVIGPALVTSADEDQMTDAEKDRFFRLQVETFTFDFIYPVALQLLGQSDNFKKLKKSKEFNADRISALVEKALNAVPGAYEDVKAGKYKAVLDKFLVSQTQDILKELLTNIIKELAGNVSSKTFVQGKKLVEGSFKNGLSEYLKVLDVGLQVVDFARIQSAIVSSRPLEEWTVKAKSSDVTLLPARATTIPFQPEELQVIAKTHLSDGAAFQYDWSTSGKYGTISDDRGHSGTSFTSSLDKITYKSNVQSDELGENENIEEIYVTVSIKKGNKITTVNSDTARINVQPFRYEIKPDGITVQGGTDVKLNIERVDMKDLIAPNSEFDYKVVWSTGGAYGKLEGGENTITTYDSDTITYQALDKEVEEGTENFTARIYFKSKDKSDWVLLDEAKGSIKIKNDDHTVILYGPVYVRVTPFSEDSGDYRVAASLVSFKPPKNAESYSVTVFFKGWHSIGPIFWKEGQPVPSNYRYRQAPDDGKYYLEIGFTQTSDDAAIARHKALYAAHPGYGQIVVTLKDEGE